MRDAQGNVLAVYEQGGDSVLQLSEHHLYGSSRLGLVERAQNMDSLKVRPVTELLLGPTYLYTSRRQAL